MRQLSDGPRIGLGLGREALPFWEQVVSALPATARRGRAYTGHVRQRHAHAAASGDLGHPIPAWQVQAILALPPEHRLRMLEMEAAMLSLPPAAG